MKSEITWHKYPDEKPKGYGYYLAYASNGTHCVEYSPGLEKFWYYDNSITYWAEMPEPPEKL